MAAIEFRSDSHEGFRQLFDRQSLEMFLHALGEPHAAQQAAATDRQVEKRGDATHGQGPGEGFQLIELSSEIATADQRADRSAGNHTDFDALFVEGSQDADMGPSPRGAATKRQGDFGARLLLRPAWIARHGHAILRRWGNAGCRM